MAPRLKFTSEVSMGIMALLAAVVGAIPGFPLGFELMMLAVAAAFVLAAILIVQAFLRPGPFPWSRFLSGLAAIAFGVWYAQVFIGAERLGRLAGAFTGT